MCRNTASLHSTPAPEDTFAAWTALKVGNFLDVAVQHPLGVLCEIAFLTGMRRLFSSLSYRLRSMISLA
jgi:hypothetical protein